MEYLTIGFLLIVLLTALFLAALHLAFRAPRLPEQRDPGKLGLPFEQVTLDGPRGRALFGWLLPHPDSNAGLIILHGWGGNAEVMLPMAVPFHRAGLNVLLFDARNHGNSDSHGHSSLPRFAEDLDHAIDWLRREHPQRSQKLAVLGHSVGAGAALLSASRRSDIAALISVSAFAHPEWMMRRYLARLRVPSLLTEPVLSYAQWIIGHRYDSFAPMNTVCKTHSPVLLVHGKADQTVPLSDAHAIARQCPRADVDLLEIDDADHDSVEMIEQHGHQLVDFLARAHFPVTGTCSANQPTPPS